MKKRKSVTGWRKGGTFMREEYENIIKNKKNVRVKRAKKGSVNRKPGTFKNFTTLSGVNKGDKFISDQLYYIITQKTISEKKKIIRDSLLPNIEIFNIDDLTKRIVKDNLKYALQQKTVLSINNVLKATINALNDTTLSGVNKIKVGDLVKVKKYGWIMRVDDIKGDLYYLENSKKGFDLSGKSGNAGSYLINEIQKIEAISGKGKETKRTKGSNYHKDTKSHNVNIRVIGGLKLKYKIFQGYDWYKGKYIYQVVGINNDFVGEWHTLKRDAQKELKYLRKKVVGGIYKSHG